MKKIVCCLMATAMIFLRGCSSQRSQTENTDSLSVITMRQDMCTFYGDEKGCWRIVQDNENNTGLNYIDFSTNREKVIAEKLDMAPAISPTIFIAEGELYLHTIAVFEDYSIITSTLTHLAPDGTVVSQLNFPEKNTVGEQIIQDDDYIYTLLYNRDAKVSTLIRIGKEDMKYEMLADYSMAALILTVYEDAIILQNGSKIISYNTTTKQQSVLPVTDTANGERIGRWHGSGNKLFVNHGNYSQVETFDIASGVQYTAKIDSPGMLADFTIHNDCVIPGYLALYNRSEIGNEILINYIDTATMKKVKSIKASDFVVQQPLARCGDNLIVVEMLQDTYPFIYHYKLCKTADYLAGMPEYTLIDMLDY